MHIESRKLQTGLMANDFFKQLIDTLNIGNLETTVIV